jgi:hypothetical protein
MCVAESDSQFDDDWLNDNQLSVVPLYTSPQIEKTKDELVEAVELLREWCGCHDWEDKHSESCPMVKTYNFLKRHENDKY